MAKGKGKGSQFERDICKRLSLWWTKEKRDDFFWRTSGSGARATTRRKTQRSTFGQYGDVQAVHPKGQPLIDLCTIELKIGYKGTNMMDIVDIPLSRHNRHPQYEKFLEQASGDAKEAGSPYWLLITRGHTKEIMIWMPAKFYRHLKSIHSSKRWGLYPIVRIHTPRTIAPHYWRIVGTTLYEFLDSVKPSDIREMITDLK